MESSPPARSRSAIHIHISLDEQNYPAEITWQTDEPGAEEHPCKAMLLSLFDANTRDTVKIDLWTNDMQIMEMDRFFFQTLRALADTYHNATRNTRLASAMQQFVQYFGEETEILPRG